MFASISASLYRRPWLLLVLLLAPPMLFFLFFYILPLAALLVQSLFRLDDFSGKVVRELSLDSYAQLTRPASIDIIVRTTLMAAAVTVVSALIAFPLAYYVVLYAPRRWRGVLYVLVLLPLWSSYLIRVFSWKLILAKEGILYWFLDQTGMSGALDAILEIPGLGGPSLSFSPIGMLIVFVYVWLPYMILPIIASLDRLPKTLLEASGDLGARPSQTFRNVTLPLVAPGIVAGSIFTFSLTLGDFVVPTVLGNSSFFIGQAVLSFQGTAGNIPLAAAFTMVPIVIMVIYLIGARKAGAFDAL